MKRRNQIINIAYGILGSFLSRNNDVDGYWALGLFYKAAHDKYSNTFKLDLLSKESNPHYKFSYYVATRYEDYLLSQIKKKKLESVQIAKAHIIIEFNVEATKSHMNKKFTWGQPFNCKIEIINEKGNSYKSEGIGWCAEHDPEHERRSIRRINSG